jgi:hypothetical protein
VLSRRGRLCVQGGPDFVERGFDAPATNSRVSRTKSTILKALAAGSEELAVCGISPRGDRPHPALRRARQRRH